MIEVSVGEEYVSRADPRRFALFANQVNVHLTKARAPERLRPPGSHYATFPQHVAARGRALLTGEPLT